VTVDQIRRLKAALESQQGDIRALYIKSKSFKDFDIQVSMIINNANNKVMDIIVEAENANNE